MNLAFLLIAIVTIVGVGALIFILKDAYDECRSHRRNKQIRARLRGKA